MERIGDGEALAADASVALSGLEGVTRYIEQDDGALGAHSLGGLEAEQTCTRAKINDALAHVKSREVKNAIANSVELGLKEAGLVAPALLVEPAGPLIGSQ